jgi:kinesin family protein 3/17
MLREMQDEISRLKAMLEMRKNGGVPPAGMMGAGGAFDPAALSGQPQSTEGEHMLGMDSIQGDGTVVEEIVEKEVIEDTGIKAEDLAEIKRLAAEEHAKLVEQYMAANKSEEEARSMAEEATADYQRELTRKAEILAKENAQVENMARMLADKENQLQKGGAALDAAQRKKEQLRRTEEELAKRRQEQERMVAQMHEAEEARVLMVEQYTNAGEELRAKTSKLKSLWGLYQQKKAQLHELVDEFDQERNDLLDTIRSLDRQIKLKALVMEEFIPPAAGALIEGHAVYEHAQDTWILPGVEFAGNNVQRANQEMMFGGGGGLMMGGGSSSMASPPKRSFKREQHMHLSPGQMMGMPGGGGGGGMQVSGVGAVASPSRAMFLNYAQFVQSKASAAGGEEDGGGGEKKKKKKKAKD